ncbi:hypothetical protein D3C78_1448420 [compost metagenome]
MKLTNDREQVQVRYEPERMVLPDCFHIMAESVVLADCYAIQNIQKNEKSYLLLCAFPIPLKEKLVQPLIEKGG